MQNDKAKFKTDFKQRLYSWTLSVVKAIEQIPNDRSGDILAKQVLRSATSIGANYIEAQAGSSKRDFTNYMQIALKSANETKYWLALLRDLHKLDKEQIAPLLDELTEIANMLAASVITLKGKR